MCEIGGVVFGKFIIVKVFDLIKIVLGKVFFVFVCYYVFDYFVFLCVDGVFVLKGGYCFVQFVCFVWGKLGCVDGYFYCLFLKDWYV